jgi:hypothetical protein
LETCIILVQAHSPPYQFLCEKGTETVAMGWWQQ